MTETLRIFIGYDHRQPVSYHVLSHSILERATKPVSITPLVLPTLPLRRVGLTPFTFSRFLVPHLMGYKDWALFLDIDIMLRADIAELFALVDKKYSVMVVKNDMAFEWASVMLFNCEKCETLTPEHVKTGGGLLKMEWAHPEQVGALPSEWNHLVGYDAPRPDAKLVHFTQGIPAFPETQDSEFGEEWRVEAVKAFSSVPWKELMGNSVHASAVYDRLTLKRSAAAVAEMMDKSAA